MLLTDLPSEIVSLIGTYCSQADIVNLAVACPLITDSILPGIYQCIIIDPVPRTLYGAREWKDIIINGVRQPSPASTVHTIAGIKQLLNTVTSNHEYAAMVRSFTVKGNLAISDNVLIPRVRDALKNLTRTSEFEWTACPELPPELLAEFPQDNSGTISGLESLTVDLATRSNQTYPNIKMPNLRTLRVRPFLNEQVLRWLKSIIDGNTDLENLSLCRFLDTKNEIGSSFAFVGMSDVCHQHDPCAAVSIFFSESINRPRLRFLELAQIDTSLNDASALDSSINLAELDELFLSGSGQEDEFNHGLLYKIVQAKPRLKRAKLDWRASCLMVSEFLRNCCKEAISLKITIKEQPSKILESLVNNCTQLKHLSVRILCEFSFSDLAPLAKLKEIRVLSIPFNHLVDSWRLALHMPALKVVNLELKPHSRTSPSDETSRSHGRIVNMGLLTSGILDQWNDQHRSPLQTITIVEVLRSNVNLDYVAIDGHVEALKAQIPSYETYEQF